MTGRARERSCAAALATLLCTAAPAQPPVPFATADRNPVVALHGLPDSGRLFRPRRAGFDVSVDYDASNTLHNEARSGERLFFDGESRRTTLRLGYSFPERWLVEVSVPYVEHDGGGLDDFIDDFHDVFGFSDAGRDKAPQNRLRFEYRRGGRTVLRIEEPRSGIGDMSIALGRSLREGTDCGATAWAQLKTTTGDAAELTGSGAADVAVWIAAWRRFAARWAGYAAGGGLVMGEGEVLAEQQRDWAWFGRAGGEFLAMPALALQLELAVHGPLYDSETRVLNESVQITIGGWLRAYGDSRLHIAVSEDIAVGSAPDVVFHLGWRSAY